MAETPSWTTETRRVRRFPLRSKITLPYVLLATLAGAVAAYLMTQVVVGRLEERFTNQLVEAGRKVADSVVRLEQQHLENWRLIAYTAGLADAVQTADRGLLTNIAGLAALNACQDAVDVLDYAGRAIFAAHRNAQGDCQDYGFEPWGTPYSDWRAVQRVVAGELDDQGDKYADLVLADGRWILYTAGPLFEPGGAQVGMLLVGTYLETLVDQLRFDALADVTVYAPDGGTLATSFPEAERTALTITPDVYRQTMENQGEQVPLEPLSVAGSDYVQVMGPFQVRGGQGLAAVGSALPTQWIFSSAYPARNLLAAVFGAAIIGILLVGNVLAARIVRPVNLLVDASQKVAQGDLSQRVQVNVGDEIGTLSEYFNRMVAGLRDRERVKDLFGRYVGGEVAAEILRGNINLGGNRVIATVLFADIRDFTSLTEQADPDALVWSLQEYFTAMISEIDIQHGLVNKFGGDSIMALFGAPVFVTNHAQLAVQAALRMLERLEELNQVRAERGDSALRVGIGVNTGPMVVGNMGTRERAEYTAIGDAVNTASRLSDMNKTVPGASIFVSQSTYDHLQWMQEGLEVEKLGDVKVRGKSDPLTVYAVRGWK